MGDMTTSALDPRVAPLQIRPNASAAVRPADPTKERFQVGERNVDKRDTATVEGEQPQAFAIDADNTDTALAPITQRTNRGGRGLLGAFTSFLAKMFTQGDAVADSAASTRLNGIGAYGRANAQSPSANPFSGSTSDVQSPGFPRLASGRVLDLTI